MSQALTHKIAIVTGASRGIGRAIALRLTDAGARCVLCARDESKLEAVAAGIRSRGGRAECVPLDLRLPETPARLAEITMERFGRIDIVINNAGATKRGEFLDLTEDDWSDGFALKFFGAVRLIRAAWPELKKAHGSVVNIAGTGGRTPGAEFAVGGSVNAALLSLTKALADKGLLEDVQVNAINPGLVRTDRLRKRLESLATGEGIDLATAEQRLLATERITRIGEPEDIANLVAFVVGPEGRFLQGALIDMDGGATKTI